VLPFFPYETLNILISMQMHSIATQETTPPLVTLSKLRDALLEKLFHQAPSPSSGGEVIEADVSSMYILSLGWLCRI
jgi:hypothetical protein